MSSAEQDFIIGEDEEEKGPPGAEMANIAHEATRIYDPVVEEGWADKYKNFSSPHMKRAYRTYAIARHDPFNKDPCWGASILSKLSKQLKDRNICATKLFNDVDKNHDGTLDRAELRKMMRPFNLSDLEFAAIYEIFDSDHNNVVDLDELSQALFGKVDVVVPGPSRHYDRPISTVDADHTLWRSPVHRVNRLPPARPEGWDHLRAQPEFRSQPDMINAQGRNLLSRVGADLCLSARGRNPAAESAAESHRNFGGGFDAHRFHRAEVAKEKRRFCGPVPVAVPDPGYEPRPGYHIKLAEVCPQFITSPRSGRSTQK